MVPLKLSPNPAPLARLCRALLWAALAVSTGGCQLGYYLKSASLQWSLISRRVDIEHALRDPQLDADTRRKLEAAQAAHEYGIRAVGLKETSNYTTYVRLDRPYVSWVVSASPRWRLEHHLWNFPIVGRLPYKGFAAEDDARAEKKLLDEQGLDTYLRGVSAYSTLGWFSDSVLSSMLRGNEHDLVNTILHETTHTTLYIRGSADFNERLAVFVANRATQDFYLEREGPDSPTVRLIQAELADDRLFSEFISQQITELRAWYASLKDDNHHEDVRRQRLRQIQTAFTERLLPRLKTPTYRKFAEWDLNNARLMHFSTYLQDLADFEALFETTGRQWPAFFACVRSLDRTEKPEEGLKNLLAALKASPSATTRSGCH